MKAFCLASVKERLILIFWQFGITEIKFFREFKLWTILWKTMVVNFENFKIVLISYYENFRFIVFNIYIEGSILYFMKTFLTAKLICVILFLSGNQKNSLAFNYKSSSIHFFIYKYLKLLLIIVRIVRCSNIIF